MLAETKDLLNVPMGLNLVGQLVCFFHSVQAHILKNRFQVSRKNSQHTQYTHRKKILGAVMILPLQKHKNIPSHSGSSVKDPGLIP